MQKQTERGIISVSAEYKSGMEAESNGYTYAFTSHDLGCDVYSKRLDDVGHRHDFALVKKG